MDVYGNKPTAPEGRYFRRNVMAWSPLADFCLALAAEECRACTYWHANERDGLNAEQARRLAQRLEQLIVDGTAAGYIARRDSKLAAVPDVPCPRCEGTGKERSVKGLYRLDIRDVMEFAAFLKASGGFEIW
jgi:hypothetical protein